MRVNSDSSDGTGLGARIYWIRHGAWRVSIFQKLGVAAENVKASRLPGLENRWIPTFGKSPPVFSLSGEQRGEGAHLAHGCHCASRLGCPSPPLVSQG